MNYLIFLQVRLLCVRDTKGRKRLHARRDVRACRFVKRSDFGVPNKTTGCLGDPRWHCSARALCRCCPPNTVESIAPGLPVYSVI